MRIEAKIMRNEELKVLGPSRQSAHCIALLHIILRC